MQEADQALCSQPCLSLPLVQHPLIIAEFVRRPILGLTAHYSFECNDRRDERIPEMVCTRYPSHHNRRRLHGARVIHSEHVTRPWCRQIPCFSFPSQQCTNVVTHDRLIVGQNSIRYQGLDSNIYLAYFVYACVSYLRNAFGWSFLYE